MKRENGKKVVCVSGYFNPLHVGHISLLRGAKELGDDLVVIVNNDNQVKVKGSVPFMSEDERAEIIRNLRMVDEVFVSIDQDKTVCKTLEHINPDIFANGGDRNDPKDIPEKEICDRLNIELIFGVGGDSKQQASSVLIKKAAEEVLKKEQKV
jgi:cytidyltransferase-like protein